MPPPRREFTSRGRRASVRMSRAMRDTITTSTAEQSDLLFQDLLRLRLQRARHVPVLGQRLQLALPKERQKPHRDANGYLGIVHQVYLDRVVLHEQAVVVDVLQ